LRPLKYIFLSPSSKGKNLKYYDLNNDFIFVGSWAGLLARRLKKYKPELDISIWIMEPFVNRPLPKKVFDLDGIIWPYKNVLIKNILSFSMYLMILRLSLRNNIILHYHSLFDRFILLKYFLPGNVKIVLSHHGGIPPANGSLKDLFFRLTLRHVSAITYLSLRAKEYLQQIGVPEDKVHFLPVGADFKMFQPYDKSVVRKKLGLDLDTVYGIYVGSFYRLKSVDLILDIYYALRQKYNFSVIFVGGEDNENNNLYNEVINSGCPWFRRQEWIKMPDFYNAADFYIHPALNPQFGGLDVSWIEALACNKPVISPQLAYLDFDYSELGVLIKDKNEVVEKTEWMINNYKVFTKCRETAQKYLDGNTAIMAKLICIYEKIFWKDPSHNEPSSGL